MNESPSISNGRVVTGKGSSVMQSRALMTGASSDPFSEAKATVASVVKPPSLPLCNESGKVCSIIHVT